MKLLTSRQITLAVAYSAIFPVTNLAGDPFMSIGIIATLPFLGLAWIGGMFMVSLIGTEEVYLIGSFLTILLQVLLLLMVRDFFKGRKANAT